MNIKTFSVLFGSLLSALFLFASCQEEEEVYDPKDDFYWGYFKGAINEKEESLENTLYKKYIDKRNIIDDATETSRKPLKGCSFKIFLPSTDPWKEISISFSISHPEVGTRHITAFPENYDFSSCDDDAIIASLDVGGKGSYIYSANPDKPVRVTITNMDYDKEGYPRVVEGEIEGTVYFGQESISFNGKFGVR